ncbi:unnamed protein product [Echinostoma caproni]|uniref:Reverse transcriptase domain-containing protein n=1 Tax=Echinostoma caproni TaxID=27848 RepID=A0A183B204_9TREM|nr:unnamed protein product [Echinostoma caproni]
MVASICSRVTLSDLKYADDSVLLSEYPSDAIPEETGTEVDESLSKVMSKISTTSASSTQPPVPGGATYVQSTVDSGELVRFSPTGTTVGSVDMTSALTSTAMVPTSATPMATISTIQTTAPLAPSFFTDPFSAAPFNPATIQQHQVGVQSPTKHETNDAMAKQLSVRTVVDLIPVPLYVCVDRILSEG